MTATAPGPARQILLIRHGEKPDPLGRPAGIKPDGSEDHHSLIVRGWQRAGALVPFFCAPQHPAIRSPSRLYAPPLVDGKAGDHGRPYQTISPLAERLELTIGTSHALDDEERLAADLRAGGGTVLVAWEHKRIPAIANAILGQPATAPQHWPDERFDLVWVFDLDASGTAYRFSQVPQLLLAGDQPDIIRTG